MIRKMYDEFKKESIYGKIRRANTWGYIIYFVFSMIGLILFIINASNDDMKLAVHDLIVLVVIGLLGFFIFIFIGINHIMQNKGIISKAKFILDNRNSEKITKYYLEKDRDLIKKILDRYKINNDEKLKFIIERFEKETINKKMNILTFIPIISLTVTLVSFFNGGSNVTHIEKINSFLAIMSLVVLVPLIKAAFNSAIKRSYAKNTIKQFFNEIIVNEYISR